MDPAVYKAAKNGTYSSIQNCTDREGSELQVTCQKNTILHIAVKHGNTKAVEKILDSHSSLKYEANMKGDTPLHIAARLGYLEVAKLLLRSFMKDQGVAEAGISRNPFHALNMRKNTALHEAVQNGHKDIVDFLIDEDQSLASFRNDAGESPLFMAVERRFCGIALCILESFTAECCPPCTSGRNGMNSMHAAVICLQDRNHRMLTPCWWRCTAGVFKFLVSCMTLRCLVFKQTHENLITGEEIVNKVLEKCGPQILEEKDDFGWIPLHYAAYTGNVEVVKLFLKSNSSLAYITDEEGMSALHISSKSGKVGVVETLLKACPDVCELSDYSIRTALHVAVESGREDVVMSLLKTGDFDDLMNEQDHEGNTALHLAALHGHVGILKMLAKHKTVDNGAINNLAMTAVDIIQSSTELNKYNKVVMTSILELKGAQPSLERRIFGKKRISQLGPEMSSQSTELQVQVAAKHGPSRITSNEKNQYLAAAIVDQELELEHSNHSSRQTKNLAQVNLIVATIIASITFAAAITMPGGYKDKTGIPILNEKPHFRYFLAFNSLAFGLSASSMSIHFIFPLCSKILGDINYSYPSALLVFLADCSIFSSVLAFVAATNAVLREKGISLPANIALCSFYVPIVFFGIQIGITVVRRSKVHIQP